MPRSPRIAAYRKLGRWSAADARAVLSAVTASGLSTGAFAAREGLSAERLYRWRWRLRTKRGARPAFIELRPTPSGTIEIVLRSGRLLRVAESVDAEALGRLIEVLERPGPC